MILEFLWKTSRVDVDPFVVIFLDVLNWKRYDLTLYKMSLIHKLVDWPLIIIKLPEHFSKSSVPHHSVTKLTPNKPAITAKEPILNDMKNDAFHAECERDITAKLISTVWAYWMSGSYMITQTYWKVYLQ